MARFRRILMDKVEKERREEIRQEKLKAESGIKEGNFLLTEKGSLDYGKAVFRIAVHITLMILAFVGIMMVLNPESRGILMERLHWP